MGHGTLGDDLGGSKPRVKDGEGHVLPIIGKVPQAIVEQFHVVIRVEEYFGGLQSSMDYSVPMQERQALENLACRLNETQLASRFLPTFIFALPFADCPLPF